MKVILTGDGPTLPFLASAFRAKGHSVVVVCADEATGTRLTRDEGLVVVVGDGSEEQVLEQAGARSANVVLAATTSDADNLVTCRVAKARYGVPRVVALANDPENEAVFTALGVEAVSTAATMASLIEQRAAIDRVTQLLPAADGKVVIVEVVLAADSPAAGRPLADLDLPRQSNVALVLRGEDALVPRGDTKLAEGDRVLLVCTADIRARALARLTG